MFATVNNRVQLIGFVGGEIKVKVLPDDSYIVRFEFATWDCHKTPEGKKETFTTWHNILATGKNAKHLAINCAKGERLFIEGRLQYTEYKTLEGTRRLSPEILVTDFKRLQSADR